LIPLEGVVHADVAGVVIAFGAGILSFISPCCLPLVPGYIGLMAGVATGEGAGGDEDASAGVGAGSGAGAGAGAGSTPGVGRVLVSTLLFVAGFTIVFVLLGAGASSFGNLLVTHRRGLEEGAGVLTLIVAVLLMSGASPGMLSLEKRFHASPSALGIWAPPVMGMAFAFGWTPCIGPVLGAVLSEAAARDTVVGGMVLLAFYSLGLGVPFVLAGLAWGKASGAVRWIRSHYRPIYLVAGLMLGAWGVLLVAGRVNIASTWFAQILRDLHLTRLTVS